MTNLDMPAMKFNIKDKHIKRTMKDVLFLDIETSLNQAYVFRTGTQFVGANQLTTTTKILTVAGGSMYDLYTKGAKGVWGYSNHTSKNFKKDPLDDTEVLRKVWDKLDKAKVVVAHNASFDEKWLRGRFLELGWKQPSRFSLVCTYRSLSRYNLTSKKLDELSQTLVGSEKLSTDFNLWVRCSQGDKSAFKEMLAYNKGDIYDTMFMVYLRTCQYYPQKCIDMTDHNSIQPQCRTTGEPLVKLEDDWINHSTMKPYHRYINPSNGLEYVDRYTVSSKNAGRGLVKHHQ